jgi:protein-S-isoprenylcysteine O-methyltransferase Ste14
MLVFTFFLAIAIGTADVLLLLLALGGWRPLLAHRPALVMLALWAAAGLAGVAAHPRGEPRPLRRGHEPRWVIVALSVLPFATLFAAAWSVRHGLAVLPGGSVLAWLGVALAGGGGALRAASVVQLRRHFMPSVLVHEGHVLAVRGLYARLRHPAYLGALMSAAGAGLAFRSALALGLALFLLLPLRIRIRREERLLAEHFGAGYEDYRGRTGGLWPRLRVRPG